MFGLVWLLSAREQRFLCVVAAAAAADIDGLWHRTIGYIVQYVHICGHQLFWGEVPGSCAVCCVLLAIRNAHEKRLEIGEKLWRS